MQDGVGGAAHGDIEGHGVFESGLAGDGTGQHAVVILLVIALRQLDDHATGAQEQLLALGMGGEQGAVARQGQAQGLGQAVHRVGGEHAGAGAAGRAGGALHRHHIRVGFLWVGGGDHGIDQVEMHLLALDQGLARFHRPTGYEDHRDIEPQRGIQHAGGDLVAVGDAHQGVGAMGVDHVLDGIGDQLARGQGVEHAAVTHGDAVVDGDGIEFLGHATGLLDLARDQLAHVLEVDMAGHELGEGVGDGDDRLAEILVGHAGGAPQRAGAGHVAAGGGGAGTVFGHGRLDS